MEVAIRFFGEEDIFLEIGFIQMEVFGYTVVTDPAIAQNQGMKEEEVKKFSDGEYRFLSIHKSDYNRLIASKSSLKVIAEDGEGRMIYSNVIQMNDLDPI